MLVFICNTYERAKEISEVMETRHQFKTCAVEAEWGDKSLDTKDKGVYLALNHHSSDGIQPSMVFKTDYQKMRVFIASHIDTDTLFGIGWVSGLFPNTDLMKEISELVGNIDNNGIHNVVIPDHLKNYINCILQIISETKFKLGKLKYKETCNATRIVKKSILNICNIVTSKHILEKRSRYLDNAVIEIPKPITILADGKIQIFNKRINNFKDGNHDFIIIYNKGISVFGRNDEITKKYFPHGLAVFLQSFFESAGGHFSAAGAMRRTEIGYEEFKLFRNEFSKIVSKRIRGKMED